MEFGRTIGHDIIIQPSHNHGFIVEVGCGRFVYQSKEMLLNDLRDYLANSREMESLYNAACNDDNPQQVPDETQTR